MPTRTGAWVVGAVTVALLGGAAWLGADAARDDPLPADPTALAVPDVAVPLWSLRRVPDVLSTEVSVQQVQALATETLPTANHCLMVSEGGRVLGETQPDAPLTPASTQKVFTAAAALAVLGPDFTYTTQLFTTAGPGPDGVIPDLFIVGSGDPVLVSPGHAGTLGSSATTRDHVRTAFEQFAVRLAAAGVTSVAGPVAVDDSRYDQLRVVESWKPSYTEGAAVVGPIGALVVDSGYADPPDAHVQAGDPAFTAGEALVRSLTDAGITVAGPVVRGTPPTGTTPIVELPSPPLSDILSTMLRESDNTIAEMVTRELGLRVANTPTTAAGAKVIVDQLAALGVPTTGVALVDGSGLDRGATATCRALVSTLALASDPARPQFRTLYDGLSVAGESGTLAQSLEGTTLVGRLRAKTGYIDDVAGLAGFVDRPEANPPRRISFAFLVNTAASEQTLLSSRIQVGAALTDWLLHAFDPQALAPA